MKRYLFIIIMMFFVNGIYSQISKDSAFTIVKNELLGDDYLSKNVYVSKTIIIPSDTLKTFYNEIITPNYYSWFFFIDDIPFANWGHDCRYVFVNSETGYITIKNGYLPPSLKEMDVLHEIIVEYQEFTNGNINTQQSFNANATNGDNDNSCLLGTTYAIILSGGMDQLNNHVRYWNDCAFIYSTLVNTYQIDKSNVYVLMADGTDPAVDRHLTNGTYDSSPLDLNGDGVDDIQYAATKNNISTVFSSLANIITPEDNVFVFTTDHGGDGSTLILWGEIMTSTEFAAEINKINAAKSINVVMEQCFSGGYISALAGNNRVIATACKSNELSYAMSNLIYDEFVYHWTSAVNKSTPYGTIVNADYNNDGVISMDEAFQYASTMDAQQETPQYSSISNIGQQLNLSNFINNYSTSGNVTFSSNIISKGTFVINSGHTVTIAAGVTGYFYPNAKIIIKPGGKLLVNGGTLTNACDDQLWQGIEVWGNPSAYQQIRRGVQPFSDSQQGVVELKNGATIQNAKCAIRAGFNYNPVVISGIGTVSVSEIIAEIIARINAGEVFVRNMIPFTDGGGGIIIADNANFINNYQDVCFHKYEKTNPVGNSVKNSSSFSGCNFELNTNAFFSDGHADGQLFLYAVNDISFTNCNFVNTLNSSQTAIHAHASSVSMGALPFISTGVDGCSFNGFDRAIRIVNNNSKRSYIYYSFFENNKIGIEAVSSEYVKVESCDIEAMPNGFGIILKNSSLYTIANNQIHGTGGENVGIYVINSGEANNTINNNKFANLCKACRISGKNSSESSNPNYITGLQFLCNDYESNETDIYIEANSNIRLFQGKYAINSTPQSGTGNSFTNSTVNINNQSNHLLYYVYNQSYSNNSPTNTIFYAPNFARIDPANGDGCSHHGYVGDNYYLTPYLPYTELTQEYLEYKAVLAEITDGNGEGGSGFNPDNPILGGASQLKHLMDDICYRAIDLILSNNTYENADGTTGETTDENNEELNVENYRLWLERINTPRSWYMISESYSSQGNVDMARMVLDEIPARFYDENLVIENENYIQYFDAIQELNGMDPESPAPVSVYESLLSVSQSNGFAAEKAIAVLGVGLGYYVSFTDYGDGCNGPVIYAAPPASGSTSTFTSSELSSSKNVSYESEVQKLGIQGTQAMQKIEIITYPNPADNTLIVETNYVPSSSIRYGLYDIQGKQLNEGIISSQKQTIDISTLSGGVYFLRFMPENQPTVVRKVVKK